MNVKLFQALLIFFMAMGVVLILMFLALRRFVRRDGLQENTSLIPSTPREEQSTAFVAASMKGVIEELREKEKELERHRQTERDRVQDAERLSEAVTRNLPTGLLVVNAAGLITKANPAAEAALGSRTLAFRRYSEVLLPDSALTRMVTACLEQGQTFRREIAEHITPAGEVRTLGITISPIFIPGAPATAPPSDQQAASAALLLFSDLTEMTALQQQVRLKENLAALGEMSAGIADQFKNAVATITGYAQMIRAESDPVEVADSAGRILRETRALSQVVSEFLRFARPLEVLPRPVALRGVVEQVIHEIREAVPTAEIEARGEFGEVLGDEEMLRQALLGLARTAADAVAEQPGGLVSIAGRLLERSDGSVQQIAVQHNGPAIPSEGLSKVFLPFQSAKRRGVDLGLAVAQKIIVHHGGTVEARNRSQGGAEFLATLPIRRTPTP